MSNNAQAIIAIQERGMRKEGEPLNPLQLLIQAVQLAVDRLKVSRWHGGVIVMDNNGNNVALWEAPQPIGESRFAIDADGTPYHWASRAGHDRTGRWCVASWGQYRIDEENIHAAAIWAHELAR